MKTQSWHKQKIYASLSNKNKLIESNGEKMPGINEFSFIVLNLTTGTTLENFHGPKPKFYRFKIKQQLN